MFNLSPLIWVLFLTGSVAFLLYQNLVKAKPKNNLRILLSPWRKYRNWIDAQAKHETANYTSNLYQRSNNAFGMHNPSKREAVGYRVAGDRYRHYDHRGQSIHDFILWLKDWNFPTDIQSPEEYVRQLKMRNYFTDSVDNYTTGLKKYL